MVIARTTEGDVGILATTRRCCRCWSHGRRRDPRPSRATTWVAAVDGGFLSVANNRVSILSEHAELSHEIDVDAGPRRPRAPPKAATRTTSAEAAPRRGADPGVEQAS